MSYVESVLAPHLFPVEAVENADVWWKWLMAVMHVGTFIYFFLQNLCAAALCAKIIWTVSEWAVTRFLHLVPNEVFIKATFPQPSLNMHKLKFRCWHNISPGNPVKNMLCAPTIQYWTVFLWVSLYYITCLLLRRSPTRRTHPHTHPSIALFFFFLNRFT